MSHSRYAVRQVDYSMLGIFFWTVLRMLLLAASWIGGAAIVATALVAKGDASFATVWAGAPAVLAGLLWVTALGKATELVDEPAYWSAATLPVRVVLIFGSAWVVGMATAQWLEVASATIIAALCGGAALAAVLAIAGLLLTDWLWIHLRTTRDPDRPLRTLVDLGSQPGSIVVAEVVGSISEAGGAVVGVVAPPGWDVRGEAMADLDVVAESQAYSEPATRCGAAAILFVGALDLHCELDLYRELKRQGLQLWVCTDTA